MPSLELGQDARRALLELARSAIQARLEGQAFEPEPPEDPALSRRAGAFVTLHKQGALRGCIGSMEGHQPLYRTVAEMACSAAFEDPRFLPLSAAELAETALEISVLSPLETVVDPHLVEVGRHGLMISQGARHGVLLPQVPVQHGWDRESFLKQGCRKAGLPPNAWREGAHLQVFEAEVFGETEGAVTA